MRRIRFSFKACFGIFLTIATIMALVLPSLPVAAATYTITVRTPANGTISPGTTSGLASGSTRAFNITPNGGYAVQDIWTSDGTTASSVFSLATDNHDGSYTYTFTNITKSWTIGATFSPYTLELVGATTVTLTQAQFNSMVATPADTFTDNNAAVWTGVPLWKLIGLVDDGDPTTFNTSIDNTYSLNITCSDSVNSQTYTNTLLTTNTNFATNNHLIVANTYNGGSISPISIGGGTWAWGPLRLIGNTTSSGSSYFSHYGGGLTIIQLTSLPTTYQVTASAGVSGTGYYAQNASVTLTETPATGYHFVNWTSSDITISDATDNPLIFTMPASSVAVTANFAANPPDAAHSVISASPVSITANGVSTSTITVTEKDASGNALTASGTMPVLNTNAGTLGSVTDNSNGTYTATLTSVTTTGTATVSGTIGGIAIGTSATVAFAPGAVDAAHSALTPTSSSITANGTSTQVLTVTAKDANGNALTTGGATVTITQSSGTGTISAVTDNSNGTYTATVTSPAASGSGVFVATLNGNPVKSGTGSQTQATVNYIAGTADATQSTLTPTSSNITANGTSTQVLTVTAKDANGNALTTGGATVTITQSSGTGTISAVTDNSNGTYTATVTSPAASGSGVFVATLNGNPVKSGTGSQTQATVNYIAGTADATQSTLTPTSSNITANGTSTQVLTVTAKDANGNALTTGGATVTITQSSGTGTISAVTDNSNGTYTATVTSPAASGSGVFVATLGGNPVKSGTGSQTQATVNYIAVVVYVPAPVVTTTTTPPGNLAGKINTTTGDFTAPVTVPSADNEANVSIVTGVTGTINGAPLTQITVAPAADPQTTPDSNANFRIGNVFYNFGPNGAQFSNPVTLTLPYDPSLGNNAYIAYWDTIANPPAWKSLSPPFEIDTVHNTITGQTTHFTVFSVLAPPIKPASFSFSNLSITPSEAAPGQDVVITATVTNSGDLSGRYSAQLLINGSVASTKSDSLAGNQAQTIGFSVHEDTAATYNVVLGDLKGSFTITAVEMVTTLTTKITPAPTETPSTLQTSATTTQTTVASSTSTPVSKAASPAVWIFIVIGVVVVIALTVGVIIFRKRTPGN